MGMKLALVLAFVYEKDECEEGNFVLSIWLCKLQISNSINRLLGWMMWGQIGIWSWKESYWFISWWRNGIVWRQQTNFFVGKIDGLEKSILLESSRHKEAMESSGGGDRKGHFRYNTQWAEWMFSKQTTTERWRPRISWFVEEGQPAAGQCTWIIMGLVVEVK